jgi:hypothetical protein
VVVNPGSVSESTRPSTLDLPAGPAEDDPERSRSPRWFWLTLALVVVGALLVRLVGVTWGLPYVYHPDEPVTLKIAHDMVVHRTLNPHFFDWGSASLDLQAFVHGAYATIGEALGQFGSVSDVKVPSWGGGPTAILQYPSSLLVARLVSVVLGVGLVLVGAWMAWLVTRTRSAALLAAALIAVNPILARNARWATPDTMAGLMTTVAIVAAVLIARDPRRSRYVFAGITVGLATASKYNTVTVVVVIVFAHVLVHGREAARRAGDLVISAVTAIVVFLLADPYSVLDWQHFWHGVTYDMTHYGSGHPGYEGNTLSTNLRWLWNAIGPALLVPLFAWRVANRSVRRLLMIPLLFVVVFGTLMSIQRVRFERNLVPLLPALLVVIAVVATQLVVQLVRRRPDASIAIWTSVLTPILLWGSIFAIQDAAVASRDSRADAQHWISRHVPRGSTVFYDVYSPYVDPARFELEGDGFVLQLPNLDTSDADAVIVTAAGSGRFLSGVSRTALAERNEAWLRRNACQSARFNRGSTKIEVFRLKC